MNYCRTMIDYDYVKIKLKDGDTITGCPICLEYADETDSGEDEIDIETEEGGIFGIKESEIESWGIPLGKFKRKKGKEWI